MSSIPIRFKRRIGSSTFDARGQSLKLERDNKFSCSLVLHIVSIINFSISDNGPKIKSMPLKLNTRYTHVGHEFITVVFGSGS